jgi:integrase
MECTYNESTRKFKLIYFDALKAARGDKYPYGRKQKAWKSKTKPTRREKEIEIANLLKEGALLEEAARIQAEKLKNEFAVEVATGEIVTEDKTDKINAVKYLLNVQASKISDAKNKKSIRRVERAIEDFAEFIKKQNPFMSLDEVKHPIIKAYFESIAHYSTDVQKQAFTYLRILWNKIIIEFENSPIKYINHFDKYGIKEYLTKNKAQDKLAFTITQMQNVLADLVANKKNKNIHGVQKFAIFYFLIVTGWRVSDILSLEWKQINMQQRTIKLTHSKTEDTTGHETIIYITPLMMEILTTQKENAKMHPYSTHLVFNIRHHLEEITNPEFYIGAVNAILYPSLEKQGILSTTPTKTGLQLKNYTVHCFRKSTITELDLSDQFTPDRITYLVGHANNTVEAKHYRKLKMYPERSTRKMLEHMEEITNLRYYWNCLLTDTKTAVKKEHDANKWLDAAKLNELKLNFWNEDAINALYEAWKNGTKITIIEAVIYTCNTVRTEQAHDAVTKESVKDVLQMMQWVNAQNTLDKQLNA